MPVQRGKTKRVVQKVIPRPRAAMKKKKRRQGGPKPDSIVYCLTNANHRYSYVGVTQDMKHRLRQHNGEIKKGARYTHNIKVVTGENWRPLFLVSGFATRQVALQLEWRMHKHRVKLPRGKNPFGSDAGARRAWELFHALKMERVTKKAPLTKDLSLVVTWGISSYSQTAASLTWTSPVAHLDAQRELLRRHQHVFPVV